MSVGRWWKPAEREALERWQKASLLRRTWWIVRGLRYEFFSERMGIHVLFEPRERFPNEPFYWALNFANGSGSQGRLGSYSLATDWQLPFGDREGDPVPAWARGDAG